MVIICPECSTKFRVNSERIPASGAKVRCARCKHVFIAEKPEAGEEPLPIIAESPALPTQPEPEQASSAEQSVPDEETTVAEEAPADSEINEDSEIDSAADSNGFSYDQFRDLDTTKTDAEDFTFGAKDKSETAPESEQVETALAPAPESEESFSFSAPGDETTDNDFATAETEPVESSADPVPDAAHDSVEDNPKIDEDIIAPATPAPQNKPATSISRILLLLILALLILGGALYVINGPQQFEAIIQQFMGQQTDQPTQTGQIAVANLEGKFIHNQESGELFVIRGDATNNFSEARASIQVKGVIFDQNGKPLLQKTIFCGNPISDQEMQTLSFSKLEEMMGNQFGKAQKNMKINSKQAIPFVIAFRDLPKDLSEFSVDVTSSEPVAQ